MAAIGLSKQQALDDDPKAEKNRLILQEIQKEWKHNSFFIIEEAKKRTFQIFHKKL